MSATEPDVFKYEILVFVLETKSVTVRTLGIRAASVRKFFEERFVKKQQRKHLGGGQAHGVHQPFFSQRTTRVGEARNCWQILFLLSDFLTAEGNVNASKSPISRKRRSSVAKPLETTAPNGRLTALNVGVCKVDRTSAAVLTLIMFETGTVRSKSGEAGVTISLNSSL